MVSRLVMPAAALITLSSLPWVLWHRFTSPPAPPAELASMKMVGINPVSPVNMHTQTANASTTGGTGSSADISIVCMGDSHSRHDAIEVPFADVLLHSGDFSMDKRSHIVSFNEWLGKLPHRHKVVVAGNHDSGRDVARAGGSLMSELKGLLTNAIYLCDEFVDLPVGLDNRLLRVYASPWQPQFRHWNSYRTEAWHGMILERTVPKDRSVHVVLTHSPPWSILDEDEYGKLGGKKNVGSKALLALVKDRRPLLHCFGHIHASGGKTLHVDVEDGSRDVPVGKLELETGKTLFVNDALVTDKIAKDDRAYELRKGAKPILVRVPIDLL